MYWALLADPGSDDEKGFTPEQLEAMGAGAGRALYEALRAAAQRGVHIRILQSPGFSGPRQGSDALQADFPDRISIHSVEMGKWYGGGGIMHQKVWIFDQRHLYLGSANMDWKSITQVKEMGWSSKIARSSPRTPASISRPGGLSPPFRRRASRCSTRWRASIGACRHGRSSCRRSSAHSRRWPAGSLRPRTTGRRRSPWTSAGSGGPSSSPAARKRSSIRGGPGTRKGWSAPSTTRANPYASV